MSKIDLLNDCEQNERMKKQRQCFNICSEKICRARITESIIRCIKR
ncbi:hypothetical protein TTRE_0000175001 [Trichuris trichiura]|uniref:Uncharacterized protein n=1 Tax=Trichuris trichiura TaxID=36087 RepID=A0A077Z434_TRITR|nr:hypothetical protein TTRE_0000175001 [Trichuris trichiura]